jgi:hypothetical protein
VRVTYRVAALAGAAALALAVPATPAGAAPGATTAAAGDRVTLLTGGGVLDGRTADAAAVDARGAAQLPDGDILVADGHRRIRLIDGAANTVSTLAGTSTVGTGSGAELTGPRWADRRDDGTTVFADGDTIRTLAADGTLTTLATVDATAFALDRASGDAYVGDAATKTVVAVHSDGTVTTVAGGGTLTGGADGPATSLKISAPTGLAVMPDGSVLVRESRYLWQVANGTATRVSGTPSAWARAPRAGAPVAGAALPSSGPGDLAVSPNGTVSLADGPFQVRQFTLGGTISFRRYLPCSDVAGAADDGTLLLACGVLYRATATGVTRLAGGSSGRGTVDTSPDGTPGREAAWSSVVSPVSDGTGRVWFGTGEGGTVMRYDDADGTVRHVAGTPGGSRTDGALATEADLGGRVNALALLPGGRLAVSTDTRVSIVEADGTLTFLTRTGRPTLRFTEGTAAGAVWTAGEVPLAVTPSGTLLLAVFGVVLEVDPADRTVVRVLGGNPFSRYAGNGLAAVNTNLGRVRALAPFGDDVAVLTGSRGDEAIRLLSADGRVGTLAQGAISGIAPAAGGGLLAAVDGTGLVRYAADRSVALLGTGGAVLADDADLADASLDRVQLTAEPTGVLLASSGRLRRAAIADMTAAGSVPAGPADATLTPAADGRSLRADWTLPTGGTQDKVEVRVDGTLRATLAADATTYTVTGLTPGAEVTVAVHTGVGDFARSVPAVATAVMPGDTTAPRLYDVRIGDGKTIPVSWSAPGSRDVADVVVVTRTDRLPADPADGTQAYAGLLGPVSLDAPARPASLFVGVFVRDWSGNVSRAAAREVRPALPPAPVVTAPASYLTTTAALTLSWRAVTDPWGGTPSYEVTERSAPHNGLFGAWSAPEPTTGTSLTYPVDRGTTYCHQVRAVGEDGGTGPWSPARCTAVPLDDTALTAGSGWTTATGSVLYGGSARKSSATGAALTVSGVYGSRLALVASTCPTCGTVGVYVDNRLVGSVNLASRRGTAQSVFLLPSRTMSGATVTLKVLSRGRVVTVDALAFLR